MVTLARPSAPNAHTKMQTFPTPRRVDVLHTASGGIPIVGGMNHDAAHKYIYMLAAVVADLLRLVVPEWADDLDLTSVEDVSAEYLDEDHRKRLGDMVWKVRFRDGQLADGQKPYILVLVEFQATVNRDMAKRIREYTGMLLDRLVRNGVVAREGGLPRVLAVVVYNGSERWTAIGEEDHLAPVPSARAERDLALLQPQLYRRIDENSRSEHDWPEHNLVAATVRLQGGASPDELLPRLLDEANRFGGPGRRAFRQALHAWAKALWADEMGAEAPFPSFEELEQEKETEMTTMLHARWERHYAKLRAEGREQGLAQALEEGLADGRTRLRRQAALRFGTATAERFSASLAKLASREDLDRVSEWIIECESGEDLLTRVYTIASPAAELD